MQCGEDRFDLSPRRDASRSALDGVDERHEEESSCCVADGNSKRTPGKPRKNAGDLNHRRDDVENQVQVRTIHAEEDRRVQGGDCLSSARHS
ncbi:hypothetical protein ACFPRL_22925 [Pseudoclavibacter helvolus]